MASRYAATKTGIGRTATSITQAFGHTYIKYHDTNVVVFNDERIMLDTGGWFTNTTKARMNQAAHYYGLGFSVFQRDHQFNVEFAGKIIRMLGKVMVLNRLTGNVIQNEAA